MSATATPITHTSMTQMEYITYKRYLDEITTIAEHGEIPFSHLVNAGESTSALRSKNFLGRVRFINSVHEKLLANSFSEKTPSDCAPLAADLYNTSQKAMNVWNRRFSTTKDLCILTPTKELKPGFSLIYLPASY